MEKPASDLGRWLIFPSARDGGRPCVERAAPPCADCSLRVPMQTPTSLSALHPDRIDLDSAILARSTGGTPDASSVLSLWRPRQTLPKRQQGRTLRSRSPYRICLDATQTKLAPLDVVVRLRLGKEREDREFPLNFQRVSADLDRNDSARVDAMNGKGLRDEKAQKIPRALGQAEVLPQHGWCELDGTGRGRARIASHHVLQGGRAQRKRVRALSTLRRPIFSRCPRFPRRSFV